MGTNLEIIKSDSGLKSKIDQYVHIEHRTEEYELKLLDESILMDLLKKNQKEIISVDKDYIKQFIKIVSYLRSQNNNILTIYNGILNDEFVDKLVIKEGLHMIEVYKVIQEYYKKYRPDKERKLDINELIKKWIKQGMIIKDVPPRTMYTKNKFSTSIFTVTPELDENYFKLLSNNIYLYDITLLYSIKMVKSLLEDDLITFYEIYEQFDQLNIYNSNWENELSERLKNIEDRLGDLLFKMDQVNNTLINGFSKIINSLQGMETSLMSINSSIKWNNILSTIQTYQLYKINKNTK
jgi:hypothetical protein